MQDPDIIREFSDCLVAAQSRLYSYIFTLLPWSDQANDVLQETNLVLWREADEFASKDNFLAWACRVAYFQVLTYRKKTQRDRMVFGEAFLEGLARQTVPGDDNAEEEGLLLHDCLKELPVRERALIQKRYDAGNSVKAIAVELDETPNAVAVNLFRIRQSLLKCVQDKLAQRDRE